MPITTGQNKHTESVDILRKLQTEFGQHLPTDYIQWVGRQQYCGHDFNEIMEVLCAAFNLSKIIVLNKLLH